MNEGLRDVYNHYLGLSAEERKNYADNAAGKVADTLHNKGLKDEDIARFILSLLGLAMGADGKITQSEADILNRLFNSNYTPHELVDFVSSVSSVDSLRALDKVVDSLDDDTKVAACVVVLAVISADGDIDENEAAALEILLADHFDF